MFKSVVRPGKDEDEDDLLQFQEQFLKNKDKPCANVFRVSKVDETVLVDERRKANMVLQNERALRMAEQEKEMEKCDRHITKVLKDIVTEKTSLKSVVNVPQIKSKTAFPPVFKRTSNKYNNSKKSIFAEEMEKKNQSISKSKDLKKIEKDLSLDEDFEIKENQKVFNDNLQKELSEEEILRLKEEVLKKMTNDQIMFLKQRGRKKVEDESLKKKATQLKEETNLQLENEIKSYSNSIDMIQEVAAIKDGNYLNMNKVEDKKLEWLKEVETSKVQLSERFDFQGRLVSFDESKFLSSKLGLHHHGSQPDLAGYSLQELLDLTRSTNLSQRCISLNTLGKIIYKERIGGYQTRFIQELLNAGFFFLLRMSMDEKSDVMMRTSISCLHSLVCRLPVQKLVEDEEFVLWDCAQNFPLQTSSSQFWRKNKTDIEVASSDLLMGLLKTDIIIRFKYLIQNYQLDSSTILQCCEILESLSKHSMTAANLIFESSIIKLMLEKVSLNRDHILLASILKTIRHMTQSGRHIAHRIIENYSNIPTILQTVFFMENNKNIEAVSLEMEAIKYLIVLTSYGNLPTDIKNLYEMLRPRLNEVLKFIEDCFHLTFDHVLFIQLIFTGFEYNPKDSFNIFISISELLVEKLSNENLRDNEKRTLAISINYISIFLNKNHSNLHEKDQLKIKQLLDKILQNLNCNYCFEHKFTKRFCWNQVPSLSDPSLKGLPTDLEDVKMLTEQSCQLNFLDSQLRCRLQILSFDRQLSPDTKKWLIDFVRELNWSNTSMLHQPFILYRLSSSILFSALNLGLKMSLSALDVNKLHLIAFNLSVSLRRGDEDLFRLLMSLIFHPDFFRSLDDTEDSISPQQVRQVYLPLLLPAYKILEVSKSRLMKNKEDINSFFVSDSTSSIVPLDWPFAPILNLYNKSLMPDSLDTTNYSQDLLICLKFLSFLEEELPDYMTKIEPCSKLLRLMCVFLAEDDLFLSSSTQLHLHHLFLSSCKSLKKLPEFPAQLPGVTSFVDFYETLLEQYEAVSMRNELFSAVVLLPLHQSNRFNKDLKRSFWITHQSSLLLHSVTADKLLIPIESYLEPADDDLEILGAYVNACCKKLVSSKKSPVLYQIATNHIRNFICKKVETLSKSHQILQRQILNLSLDQKLKNDFGIIADL